MSDLRELFKTSPLKDLSSLRKLDMWISENKDKVRNKRNCLEIVESFKDGSDEDRYLEFMQNMILDDNTTFEEYKQRFENVVKGNHDKRQL